VYPAKRKCHAFRYMKSGRGGPAHITGQGPSQLIPRSSIAIPEGALAAGSSGAFGTVLRATRDGGAVAVKVYDIRKVGILDQRAAMQEALMLGKASHHNVVKCWGVVHDPDSTNRDSIHGSLVMEWVGGGNLYEWLQENVEAGLWTRVQLALQVAAGMRHLHAHGLVHGDLKPQNILLQFMQGEELPEVSAHGCFGRTAACTHMPIGRNNCRL
jgi:eukaryotic-like serine/threonine-protein kinase